MTLRLPTATRNANTSATTGLFDAGAGAATIRVYSGPQPASANDAPSGVLLWTWTLADPSWAAPVTGSSALDATPVISAVAVAAGTAGWCRALDSDGNTVADGAVGAELNIDNPTVVIGQTINLTAGALATPAS
jgi:hypothetical protein